MSELFWQYPVITEKTFYLQNSSNECYVALPWATIIDKRMNLNIIRQALERKIDKTKFNITCCQHIYFKQLIPFFRDIGIKVLYTPHKVTKEDVISGIIIKPCPLYAVNIEDDRKNNLFKGVDLMNRPTKYLYSFQGAYQNIYISDIRKQIFRLQEEGTGMGLKVKPDDVYIKNIGWWHFNNTVYSDLQNKNGEIDQTRVHKENTEEYNALLLESTFSLCPSGSGPNSIRFWEALAVGSIPILLSDTLELPHHPLWSRAIVRIPEQQINYLDIYLRNMSRGEIMARRKNCMDIYRYFKDNFMNPTFDGEFSKKFGMYNIHYSTASYEIGDYGNVGRYDHHLKAVLKNIRFYKAPEQKDAMLQYAEHLKTLGKSVTFVTDNHLACDIPNYFQVFVVHHGCARRTAESNPSWDKQWREFCVSGQDRLIEYRDPITTMMISPTREIQEDFRRFYGTRYDRFRNHLIHNTSDLDEKKFKTYSPDEKPATLQVLVGGNKGDVNKLKRSNVTNRYSFNELGVFGQTFRNVQLYNQAKQNVYLTNDLFVHISGDEISSFAALDAAVCGLVIVSTRVGIFREIPDTCFVKIDEKRRYDMDHVRDALEIAWTNRVALSRNLKQWYQENCTFKHWEDKMKQLFG